MNVMKLAIPLFVALAYGPSQGLAAPILGSGLASFAVLGGSTVTNTGATALTGNLGVSPGTAITGFAAIDGGPGLFSGTAHLGDGFAGTAHTQLGGAISYLASLAPTGNLTGLDLAGMTLTPGVYKFDSSAFLTGTSASPGILTLNGQNNANAFWVFQIGSTLTTSAATTAGITSSGVNFINTPYPGAGLFWNVGSSATLGTYSTFEGNILASLDITLTTGATIGYGRALAYRDLTMDTNTISTPVPEPETYAMLLAGLGLMGFVARRRRQEVTA